MNYTAEVTKMIKATPSISIARMAMALGCAESTLKDKVYAEGTSIREIRDSLKTVSQRIRESSLYVEDRTFTAASMAAHLKLRTQQVRGVLGSMIEAQEVVIAKTTYSSVYYRRAAVNRLLRMAWRKRTLEDLGLAAVDCRLGVAV